MSIEYRQLRSDECDRISEIDASHNIERAWREVDGVRRLVEINWQDEGLPNGYNNHLEALRGTFAGGGFVIGAFDKEVLIGFCSINRRILGNQYKYILLDQIFISNAYRGKGIGKRLFSQSADKARSWGADKLYICAGSAENTIAFYTSLGCVDAKEINQELYEGDTRDIQLEYDLTVIEPPAAWQHSLRIINIRESPEWLNQAADYFSSRWDIDKQLYLDSMNDSIATALPIPRWYLMLLNDEIIGGFGLIENDFMVRTDLCPWLCALYIEPSERGQELGSKLLEHGRLEAARLGFHRVYLNTDHVGYYEKYGWRYIGDYAHQSGVDTRVYEADTLRIETNRLILRPLTEADVATVRLINGDEYKTDEAALEFILWLKNPDRLLIQFYIWLRQTDQCIGRVYIHAKPEINNEVEIGYGILEEHRNQGYATEAAKAAVWYAFERAGQEVLAAIVSSENIASRRVIENLGFIRGGKRTVFHDGENREFDYFRLYHTDYLPGPEWDAHDLDEPEPMSVFFDTRADGYNEHMLSGNSSEADYRKLGAAFASKNKAIQILDIGCGTGIELDYIWERVPNAHITCVDVSQGMLELLLKNHPNSHDRITIIEASYIDWQYPENIFDIVVSNMTMHHLWTEDKTEVYRKILSTLKTGGSYIEGDFIVDDMMAEQYRRRYEIITANLPDKAKAGEYHIDIPCTLEVQKKLLQDAGFSSVEVLENNINRGNGAILSARREQ